MNAFRSSNSRLPCRILPALGLALLAGCPSPKPPEPFDPAIVESWVRPETCPVFWSIWADVRDFVGEKRWDALDTAWMADRARADLAAVTPEDDYDDEFILSGLWRLGLEREGVIAALAAREPDAEWPIVRPHRWICRAWRPRLERWLRAQTEPESRARLEERLTAAWRDALDAADLIVLAQVVEARDTWIGDGDAKTAAAAVEPLLRDELDGIVTRHAKDWRDASPERGLVFLLERFGVPEGYDLEPVVRAVRHYDREMRDATMPLPHPYDLHLTVLRLERLHDAKR